FLDPSQTEGVDWTKVVLAGHSQGSDVAAHIAKKQNVSRVIMLSGMKDRLRPAYSGNDKWGEAFGCGNDCDAGHPGEASSPFCTCAPTTYGYGTANGIGTCSLSADSPDWIADNNFGSNTGTVWATGNSRFYGFNDTDDHNWSSHEMNWCTINLDSKHDSGYGDGWGSASGGHIGAGGFHGVTTTDMCGSDSNTAHRSTASDTACPVGGPGD